jgi:hypothetical protein
VPSRPPLTHSGSVSQDWRMPLSVEKSGIYIQTLNRLETSYSMFSVNLDEALGLRRSGQVLKANQVLCISPSLCQKFSALLVGLLRAMLTHSRHFGISPNMAPLNPENFQNAKCQRVARLNGILNKVLLTRKSQFLQKASALIDLVEDLGDNYVGAAGEAGDEHSYHPDESWEALDPVHYDLNTSLREAVVLLKSFLHAIPVSQLLDFQSALDKSQMRSPSRVSLVAGHLAHRRMAPIKGQ